MLFIATWQSKIIDTIMMRLKISSECQCLSEISGRSLPPPVLASTALQTAILNICCRLSRNLPISNHFALKRRERAFVDNILPTTMSLIYQLVAAVAKQHEDRFNS